MPNITAAAQDCLGNKDSEELEAADSAMSTSVELLPIPNSCFSVLYVDKRNLEVANPVDSIDISLNIQFDNFDASGNKVDKRILKGKWMPINYKFEFHSLEGD